MASFMGYPYSDDFQFQAFSGYSENKFLADDYERYMGHASANNPNYQGHAMATKKNQYSGRNPTQSFFFYNRGHFQAQTGEALTHGCPPEYGFNYNQLQAQIGEALTHGCPPECGPPDDRLTGQAQFWKSNHAIARNQLHNDGRKHGHPAANYQASYVKSSYQRTQNYRDKSCGNMESSSESEYESENDWESESESEYEREDGYVCHGPPRRRF